MSKVFVGGSRHVSRLTAAICERLDNIMQRGLPVVVGDANGADKAVQKYLFEKQYSNVEVFCSGQKCRNNLGHWNTRQIDARPQDKGFRFYAAKDRAMAQEASYGLMVWDGKSIGTLLNVLRLVQQNKGVVVYGGSRHQLSELKTHSQWETFISNCDPVIRVEVERKVALETQDLAMRGQPDLVHSARH